ncbi:SPFH domain-containing protein, partial [Bacteroidales bacterium OttesenSCG-928-L03]|nr:SPFH domain-containing protein [Bacteroidales bacterium OttesenSCG-928-L03]
NRNSTLVVMPGEEAIFIKEGNIVSVSDSGTYNLETENRYWATRFRTLFTGGISPYNCVVYFVRKADSEEILWGTKEPIQYYDDTFGNLDLKANGAYKIKIDNPALFLTELIGNNVLFETQADLNNYFRREMQSYIAESLANAIDGLKAQGKVVFETVNKREEFSNIISPQVQLAFNKYGLELRKFSVASCTITSRDPEIQKMITDRARMNYLGDRWAAQQQVDIMKDVANNPSGGIAGAGMGLGMGVGMGAAFGGMSQQVFQQPQQQPQQAQAAPPPNEPAAKDNPVEKLKQLKEMFDLGIITQDDYDKKKQDILNNM